MRHNPIKLELDQGSKKWHEWRKHTITASRVPAIMGESPFRTPYQVWEEMQGLNEEQEQTEAMQRGVLLEPHIRKIASEMLGIDLYPAVFQHPTISYFGASLDGISDCGKIITEIKCGNKKDHENAKLGIVPEKYVGQCQAILEVRGHEIMHYVSNFGAKLDAIGQLIDPGETIIIPVVRNLQYVSEMLAKIKEFWKMVQNFTPPERQPKDFVFNESDEWTQKAQEYKNLENSLKDLERRKEVLRDDLLALTNGASTMGAGLRVAKVLEKGRVDYNRIPELIGLNLDSYRKEPITKWRFT